VEGVAELLSLKPLSIFSSEESHTKQKTHPTLQLQKTAKPISQMKTCLKIIKSSWNFKFTAKRKLQISVFQNMKENLIC